MERVLDALLLAALLFAARVNKISADKSFPLSRLSMERVLDALLLAALLFAARVNKSSADKPFP